jgi:2-polyprenyl-3-methyl-5-hydroxy-6-metoxy-1,4-benzoquinol methylase
MLDFIPLHSKRVLEVGCGAGVFLSQLSARGALETWGIDLISQSELIFQPDFYLEGPIEDSISKLSAGAFDCIVLNDVLEHLVDPLNVLSHLTPLLSPNGRIVGSIPNVLHWSVLIALLVKRDWKYEDFGVLDKTHLRFFTRKSIVRMFEDAGLQIERMVGINGRIGAKDFALLTISLGFLRESVPLQWAVVAKSGTTSGGK